MYEVAIPTENKVDSLYAIDSIMGQIASSQNYNSPNAKGNKSIYQRYPTIQATPEKITKNEQSFGAESKFNKLKDNRILKNSILRNGSMRSDRPITISEMNAYNVEQKEIHKKPAVDMTKTKEFQKSGESYHKTEICYYKTPDGGYHKLPDDSYHKKSEGCYVKLDNGNFKKLNELSNSTNLNNESISKSIHVKSNVMKFLKRSKSHTPGTIREMQKEKERISINGPATKALHSQNQHSPASTTTNQQQSMQQPNRRVMVTMIDGGLPVVATSKPHVTKLSKEKEKEMQKNRTNNLKVNNYILIYLLLNTYEF
jgi:MAP/microtubule affinity-regulating kinase